MPQAMPMAMTVDPLPSSEFVTLLPQARNKSRSNMIFPLNYIEFSLHRSYRCSGRASGVRMTSCDDELLDIFLQNESSLKRYLQTVSRSRQDAEDLTQEAWIKLARNGSAGLSNPRGYLLRIARSVGIDYNRTSRSRLKHHEIDVCLSVPDDRADPYRCTEDRDQLRQLMEIIEDLPERQRRLLIAARLEQRGHAALAKEFDVSLRTVELEIRRALDYCTARLAKKNRL